MKSIERYILEGSKFVVFVMCGMPGSGKSSWIKENHPDLPIISRDIIRAKLGYTESADEKKLLQNSKEKEVTTEEYWQIAKYAKKKKSFIVDDTNINAKYRKELISTLKSYGAYIVGVNVKAPLEVCINRRRGDIAPEVMERIFAKASFIKENEVNELITFENG